MDAVYVAGLAGLIALGLWAATRATELFRVTIKRGRITAVRGRVAPSFLTDLRDIGRHVDEGTVRAVKEDGAARLVVSRSIDERTAQRLRNAFAAFPGQKRL